MPPPQPPPARDAIRRGHYGSSLLGTSLMVGLRTADIYLQYSILARGLADPLLVALNIGPASTTAPIIALGLPLKPLLIFAMAVGSSLKQSYWVSLIAKEEMTPGFAIMVSVLNSVFNSANSILSLTTAANAFTPSLIAAQDNNGASILLLLSSAAYFVGLMMEAVSETQRKVFKDDQKNKGKLYTGGLFGLARHINYGAYTVWRSAYACASGGWIWGCVIAAFFTYDFASRGVPTLDEYCSSRYGASWAEYRKKTPYKLFPGIY